MLKIIITYIFLTSLCFAQKLNSSDAIFKSISFFNSNLDKKTARDYSYIIDKYSKKYDIDPFLIVSIIKLEGETNLKMVREVKSDKITYDSTRKKFVKEIEVTDFCMMQINKVNVISNKLNYERLIKDPDYCIHEGVKILSYFKNKYKDDAFWWTRYNAITPEKREEYKKNILSLYGKISDIIIENKNIKVSDKKTDKTLIALLSFIKNKEEL